MKNGTFTKFDLILKNDLQTLKNVFKVKFKVTNFFLPQNYTTFLSCVFLEKCFLFELSAWMD